MKTWRPEEINKLRMRLKLSQPAFGNRLGVSGNYVYLLEKGVKNPSKTLKLLLDCVERELSKRKGRNENV
jgi:DNA-binding transcriptional regulator YiaG